MKHLKVICFYLSLLIGFHSCKTNDNLVDLKKLPIKSEIPVCFFNLDPNKTYTNEFLILYFKKPYIINSEADLSNLFNALHLETPNELKNFDYEQYSLLLNLDFHLSKAHSISIQHHFYKITNQENEHDYEYIQKLTYHSANINTEDFQCYYSGILVEKIPDNSIIQYRISSH